MDYLIHHVLQRSAQRAPAQEALVGGQQRLNYADVALGAECVAQGLRHLGLERGDRVGIYLDFCIEQVLAIFGISQADGVFVPIHTQLLPQQVAHIIQDCQIKIFISNPAKLTSLDALFDQLTCVAHWISTDPIPSEQLAVPYYSWAELCTLSTDTALSNACIGQDLAALLYTSGSTGKPKGVMLSHSQIMAGSTIVSDYLNISAQERILAILPFSFDAGLNQLMTAFQQSCTLVLLNFTFARQIVQILHAEKITALAGVPTLWNLLVQPQSSLAQRPPAHLRYITNTGGAMPQVTLTQLRQCLPRTQIFLMYGLTEAFRSTYLPPEELDRRPTSIGKAIPNSEIWVLNEAGQPCLPGEVGELVHRGPTVSFGYWGQPQLTAQRLRPHPFLPPGLASNERVCYSGDLVKQDADGFLYFVGRRDTLIKSSGYRISPTEIEAVLMDSQFLQVAAVIGIPDEFLGEAIVAFVLPKATVEFNADQLLVFCKDHLPRYMIPKTILCLEQLPMTPSGKVDYPALRRYGSSAWTP